MKKAWQPSQQIKYRVYTTHNCLVVPLYHLGYNIPNSTDLNFLQLCCQVSVQVCKRQKECYPTFFPQDLLGLILIRQIQAVQLWIKKVIWRRINSSSTQCIPFLVSLVTEFWSCHVCVCQSLSLSPLPLVSITSKWWFACIIISSRFKCRSQAIWRKESTQCVKKKSSLIGVFCFPWLFS